MRLLVTRPQPQADEWVRALAAAGLQAVALPLMAIGPAPDDAALRQARAELQAHSVVVFVSPNAVASFFPSSARGGWPCHVLAAAPGPGTAQALRDAGVPPQAIVEPAADAVQFDSESLWARLAHRGPWAGRSALIVRGEGGRDWLADRLRLEGAQVKFLQAYRRSAPLWTDAQRELAQQALHLPAEHLWVFSSSEAVENLARQMPSADWGASRCVVTHPRIGVRAREAGFGSVEEIRPGLPALQHLVSRLG